MTPAVARADAAPQTVERRVLEIVRTLVDELGRLKGRGPVALDDALDRDLGLGSLERVELLVRIEQGLGIQLPDAAMAEAATARELVHAVLMAGPAMTERAGEVRGPVEPRATEPAAAATLTEVLGLHTEADPERVHIVLSQEDGSERTITYGALQDRAFRVAAGLRARGLPRRASVALMLRTEADFFPAFFGTLLAGGVPVPIYPPVRLDRIEEYARRHAGSCGTRRRASSSPFLKPPGSWGSSEHACRRSRR
jgi:fatty-acyl-CoA synthase